MDFSIEDKLKLASEKCDRNYANSFKFSTIYPFTTENIRAYLPLFDLKDKSLFTVGSSTDQALNAILCGAKDITVFDICPFTREYYYLKMAAIQTLTMDEFLKFFCYKGYTSTFLCNKNVFDNNLYLKIMAALKSISLEVEYFWTELFKRYNRVLIREQLFNMDENKYKIVRCMNYYLNNNDTYNELRNKINTANVKFIQGDIFKYEIKDTFDNIFLSNLSSYYSLAKIRELFDKMLLNLNDNGKMLLAYLYETTIDDEDYMDGEAEIYNIPKVLKTFPREIEFNSFIGGRGLLFKSSKLRDSVITYRKVKKK